jgi:hypothetical protein
MLAARAIAFGRNKERRVSGALLLLAKHSINPFKEC